MYKFLQWQNDNVFLNEDVTSPLACMSTHGSPARQAIDELLTLMRDGRVHGVSAELLLQNIVEGHCWVWVVLGYVVQLKQTVTTHN